MRGWRRAVAAAFVAAWGGLGCAHVSPAEAETAASAWTAQNPEGLTVEVDGTPTESFEPAQESGACVNDLFRLRAQTSATSVDLVFTCPGKEAPDLAWLRDHLQSYSVGLPLSIEARGWTFQALTPGSSLQSGLTFDGWTDGRVQLHIDAPLSAVVGKNRSDECKSSSRMADGGSPDCVVNVPYEGRLVLYMSMPLSPTTIHAWSGRP